MNAMLLQLIAAQASAGRNTRMAEVIARMQSIATSSPGMDPREMLAQLGNNNPTLSLLLKQMTEQQNAPSTGNEPVIDVEPVAVPPALPAQSSAPAPADDSADALHELRQKMESMYTELHILRERNDLFAAALGACCLCWGQDLSCRSCRGRGGPGFSIPDESLFAEYVVPAIQTLRAQKTKFRRSSQDAIPANAETETQLRETANY
jgi:hypothetical protein